MSKYLFSHEKCDENYGQFDVRGNVVSLQLIRFETFYNFNQLVFLSNFLNFSQKITFCLRRQFLLDNTCLRIVGNFAVRSYCSFFIL